MTHRQAAAVLLGMALLALASAIFGNDGSVWFVAAILFLMSAWQASY